MSNKRTIVVINGKGGVGKDTLIQALKDTGLAKVFNVSSIDPFRDMTKDFSPPKRKSNTYRLLLSNLKKTIDTYYEQEYGITYSNNYLMVQLRIFLCNSSDDKEILFVHIREPENIESFLTYAGTELSLRFDTDTVLCTMLIKSDRAQIDYGNDSDNNVENYNYDYIFESNGTKEEDCAKFTKYVWEKLL